MTAKYASKVSLIRNAKKKEAVKTKMEQIDEKKNG